ncbi:hypothetical protein C2G38_2210913 [Gigaspora rosea]|uniref:SUN domain-containing protein n=1 Tax=Gigaspora rosea TaxID=44941 RepID=A0A397UEU4_9GLOM|nr:hypothetical protein C2G38_2210913 [Gigaspora rosea]
MFNIKPTQSKLAKIVLISNNEAGNCFCFTGTHGQLAIQLSHNIKVVSITYEHLNPILALDPDDMQRAPKTFEILDGPPAQSFEINLQNLEFLPVIKVILKIMGKLG